MQTWIFAPHALFWVWKTLYIERVTVTALGWPSDWQKPFVQKEHYVNQGLVLPWKSHIRSPSWTDIYLCLGNTYSLHIQYVPQVSAWSSGGNNFWNSELLLSSLQLCLSDIRTNSFAYTTCFFNRPFIGFWNILASLTGIDMALA
jgi:hypothetical protein